MCIGVCRRQPNEKQTSKNGSGGASTWDSLSHCSIFFCVCVEGGREKGEGAETATATLSASLHLVMLSSPPARAS